MKNEDVNLEALDALADQLFQERETLLDTLRDLRKLKKLTQAEVAERMGVSQPTVSEFEHYDANPTLSTIMRYALAVGANLNLRAYDSEDFTAGWNCISQTSSEQVRQRPATAHHWHMEGVSA